LPGFHVRPEGPSGLEVFQQIVSDRRTGNQEVMLIDSRGHADARVGGGQRGTSGGRFETQRNPVLARDGIPSHKIRGIRLGKPLRCDLLPNRVLQNLPQSAQRFA